MTIATTTTVTLAGRDVQLRCLWARETDAIDEAYPRPVPPTIPNPNAGSLAPRVPNEADPAYQAALRRWVKDVTRARVWLATALESGATGGLSSESIKSGVASLASAMTDEEIGTLSAALAQFNATRLIKESVKMLIVKAEPDTPGVGLLDERDGPPPEPVEIPEVYDLTQRSLELRACERFGQPPEWFRTLAPERASELLAHELVRRQEERQTARTLAALASFVGL